MSDARNALLTVMAALALSVPAAIAQGTGDRIEVTAEVIALPDWHPKGVDHDDLSAETMPDDMTLYGPTGNDIGKIKNIGVGADGKALSLIVEAYGFAGIDDTSFTANPMITAEEA